MTGERVVGTGKTDLPCCMLTRELVEDNGKTEITCGKTEITYYTLRMPVTGERVAKLPDIIHSTQ